MSHKKPYYGIYIDGEYYGVMDIEGTLDILKSQIMENMTGEGEESEIRIKRFEMTTEEYEAMPDADI